MYSFLIRKEKAEYFIAEFNKKDKLDKDNDNNKKD